MSLPLSRVGLWLWPCFLGDREGRLSSMVGRLEDSPPTSIFPAKTNASLSGSILVEICCCTTFRAFKGEVRRAGVISV